MIKLSHNPSVELNAFLSVIRTTMTTTSISLALLGFSLKTKNFDEFNVKYIAIIMLLFAIIHGFKGSYDFKKYLEFLEKTLKDKKLDNREVYQMKLHLWKKWITLINILLFILLCVETYVVYKIVKPNNLIV